MEMHLSHLIHSIWERTESDCAYHVVTKNTESSFWSKNHIR